MMKEIGLRFEGKFVEGYVARYFYGELEEKSVILQLQIDNIDDKVSAFNIYSESSDKKKVLMKWEVLKEELKKIADDVTKFYEI